jgi:hypothetical protein
LVKKSRSRLEAKIAQFAFFHLTMTNFTLILVALLASNASASADFSGLSLSGDAGQAAGGATSANKWNSAGSHRSNLPAAHSNLPSDEPLSDEHWVAAPGVINPAPEEEAPKSTKAAPKRKRNKDNTLLAGAAIAFVLLLGK